MRSETWDTLEGEWEKQGTKIICMFKRRGFLVDADDMGQETLTRTANRLHNGDLPVNLGAYLWRVARSVLADACQERDQERKAMEICGNMVIDRHLTNQANDLLAALAKAETRLAVELAIQSLEEPQQSIAWARLIDGQSCVEIASWLEIEPNAVWSRFKKILRRLRKKLVYLMSE